MQFLFSFKKRNKKYILGKVQKSWKIFNETFRPALAMHPNCKTDENDRFHLSHLSVASCKSSTGYRKWIPSTIDT